MCFARVNSVISRNAVHCGDGICGHWYILRLMTTHTLCKLGHCGSVAVTSRLFVKHLLRPRSKKTSKLRVTGLCAANSIPHTKGQYRGKCFQLMTSSLVATVFTYFSGNFRIWSIFHNLLNICNYSHIRCGMMLADGLISSWCQESCR